MFIVYSCLLGYLLYVVMYQPYRVFTMTRYDYVCA